MIKIKAFEYLVSLWEHTMFYSPAFPLDQTKMCCPSVFLDTRLRYNTPIHVQVHVETDTDKAKIYTIQNTAGEFIAGLSFPGEGSPGHASFADLYVALKEGKVLGVDKITVLCGDSMYTYYIPLESVIGAVNAVTMAMTVSGVDNSEHHRKMTKKTLVIEGNISEDSKKDIRGYLCSEDMCKIHFPKDISHMK